MEKGRREWLEWLREARSSERHVDGPDVGEIDSRTDRPLGHQSHAGTDLFHRRASHKLLGSSSEDLLLVVFVRLSRKESGTKARKGHSLFSSPPYLTVPDPLAALSVAMLELNRSREPRRRGLYTVRRRGGQSQSLRARRSGAEVAGSSLAASRPNHTMHKTADVLRRLVAGHGSSPNSSAKSFRL